MKNHKAQPSYGQDGITKPWEPISEEMQKGLELAAYICRMYGLAIPVNDIFRITHQDLYAQVVKTLAAELECDAETVQSIFERMVSEDRK